MAGGQYKFLTSVTVEAPISRSTYAGVVEIRILTCPVFTWIGEAFVVGWKYGTEETTGFQMGNNQF